MRRFRPCSTRAPRAHFATKKCHGAPRRLEIGHRATSRTPNGVAPPQSRLGAAVRSRHPPSRSLAAAPQRVAQRRSRRKSVTDGPPPSGFSASGGGDCDCSLAAPSPPSAETLKHPQKGPHTAVGVINETIPTLFDTRAESAFCDEKVSRSATAARNRASGDVPHPERCRPAAITPGSRRSVPPSAVTVVSSSPATCRAAPLEAQKCNRRAATKRLQCIGRRRLRLFLGRTVRAER